jgi:hypothetical protein
MIWINNSGGAVQRPATITLFDYDLSTDASIQLSVSGTKTMNVTPTRRPSWGPGGTNTIATVPAAMNSHDSDHRQLGKRGRWPVDL